MWISRNHHHDMWLQSNFRGSKDRHVTSSFLDCPHFYVYRKWEDWCDLSLSSHETREGKDKYIINLFFSHLPSSTTQIKIAIIPITFTGAEPDIDEYIYFSMEAMHTECGSIQREQVIEYLFCTFIKIRIPHKIILKFIFFLVFLFHLF